jgi:thioredoxin reductase (NADPH)
MQEYDVVVVGAGLAGLTAGLISAQHGLSTVVIDQMGTGGQILNVDKIANLPGFPEGIAGYELGPIVQEQAEAAGAAFALDSVESLTVDGDAFTLACSDEQYRARAVILCMGSKLKADIEGMQRFEGQGVSQCASCDGPFFANQTVAVVGGGDSAIEEAAVLAGQVEKVLVFFPDDEPTAQAYLKLDAATHPNVELHPGTTVEAVLGEGRLSGVKVMALGSGEVREEAVAGVFVYTGLQPNTSFLEGVVELDGGGHVVTDLRMCTSRPGIFAAGDVRQHAAGLVASSIGDGATAAVSAHRYLRDQAPA